MKIFKKNYKYLFSFVLGAILVGSISVYAASAIIDSKDVTYNNKNSSAKNVQDSIDELYQKYKDFTGEKDTKYTEEILHGADPVLGKGMIPVTIDDEGVVKYANLNTPWYKYEAKKWANAVILESGVSHNVGDTIEEDEIAAYFVWIPRYKYKLWNTSEDQKLYNLDDLTDTAEGAESDPTALRRITGNARLIDIVFESKGTDASTEIADGKYYTHPAFISFDVNGIWVGKFEISGSAGFVKVKPNVSSWRSATIGTFWNALYSYNRELDSHMMKNTEWGAVAYLSHSAYGIGAEINVNNNQSYLTGYSAAAGTDQSSYPGDDTITETYDTATGFLASTTGNITGIYDMSGGSVEYMAAYRVGQNASTSGLNSELIEYPNYFDKYEATTSWSDYGKRIIGDATGEMGPFYYYYDKDGASVNYKRAHNAWYGDYSYFVDSTVTWFYRGGVYGSGILAGQFIFDSYTGEANGYISTRLVLSVK